MRTSYLSSTQNQSFSKFNKLSVQAAIIVALTGASASALAQQASCPSQEFKWGTGQACKTTTFNSLHNEEKTYLSGAQINPQTGNLSGGGEVKFKCSNGTLTILSQSCMTGSNMDAQTSLRVRELIPQNPRIQAPTSLVSEASLAHNAQQKNAKAASLVPVDEIDQFETAADRAIDAIELWAQAQFNSTRQYVDSKTATVLSSSKSYTDVKHTEATQYAQSVTSGAAAYFTQAVIDSSKTIVAPNGSINLANYVPAGKGTAIVMLQMNTHWNLGGYIHVNGIEVLRLHQAGQDYGLVIREIMELPATTNTFASPNGNSIIKVIGYK